MVSAGGLAVPIGLGKSADSSVCQRGRAASTLSVRPFRPTGPHSLPSESSPAAGRQSQRARGAPPPAPAATLAGGLRAAGKRGLSPWFRPGARDYPVRTGLNPRRRHPPGFLFFLYGTVPGIAKYDSRFGPRLATIQKWNE